jgi:hypothetical protein
MPHALPPMLPMREHVLAYRSDRSMASSSPAPVVNLDQVGRQPLDHGRGVAAERQGDALRPADPAVSVAAPIGALPAPLSPTQGLALALGDEFRYRLWRK